MTENNNIKFDFQKNINLQDILKTIVKRWYIIVSIILISVFATYVYSALFITPMYSSTAKIMVFNKDNNSTTNDFVFSSYLANDFTELINDKMILQDVCDELDNKYTISEIKNCISIYNPSNTRIIEISALTPNSIDSKQIVDTICTVAQDNLVELMGLDRITPISEGDISYTQTTPNIFNNCVFAFFIGLIIGFSIILIICIYDNKLNTPADIEKFLGISVLATIPYNNGKKYNNR